MEGTPAHLPFTFVRFGGHAGKSPGHAGKTIFCGRYLITLKSLLLLPIQVQGSVFREIPPHNRTLGVGEFRVGGGVHDSYTFQCGLVGSFTSPGIDTR